MTGMMLRSIGATALLALLCASQVARAQESSHPPEPGWTPSVTFTPWYQGNADFGSGGFQAFGTSINASVDGPIGAGRRAGLSLTYGRIDYTFSSPASFGGVAPWTEVNHLGLAVPLLFIGPGAWAFLVSPSVDYFVEDGADWGKAPLYGGVIAASRNFGPGLRLGLGLSAFQRLDKFQVFPFPVVDWMITKRLHLTNPLPAGPTGGGGLELSYLLDGGWTLGVGGAFRSLQFRLAEHGPFPDGIGEERAIPVFGHVGRGFGSAVSVDVYAGAFVAGNIRVDRSGGGKVADDDFDAAPFVGGTVSARF